MTPSFEGLSTGLIGASGAWLTCLVGDWLGGTPLRTYAVLGRFLGAPYPATTSTVFHFVLWVAGGTLVVVAVRAAERVPPILMGLILGFILLHFFFLTGTFVLSLVGLGAAGWRILLIGHAMGIAATAWYIRRNHRTLPAVFAHAGDLV